MLMKREKSIGYWGAIKFKLMKANIFYEISYQYPNHRFIDIEITYSPNRDVLESIFQIAA